MVLIPITEVMEGITGGGGTGIIELIKAKEILMHQEKTMDGGTMSLMNLIDLLITMIYLLLG